jgi:AraC-like DNA-binding protein
MCRSRSSEDWRDDDMAPELTSTLSTDWSGAGFRVQTLRGRYDPASWSTSDVTIRWGFVLARRGAYRQRTDGVEFVVDANTGFVHRPGEEWSATAFTTAPEELTILELETAALDHLPDLAESVGPFTVDPSRALAHRLLVHNLRSDALDIEVSVLELVHQCIAEPVRHRPSGRRGATASARRRLVGDCVELLHTSFHEQLGLVDLARRVGASPYQLSRTFREVTGITISQYRTRLRVHAVLDRLDAGDNDLAAVAADTGFADHGHMTRTMIGLIGARPTELRARLCARTAGIGRVALDGACHGDG